MLCIEKKNDKITALIIKIYKITLITINIIVATSKYNE